jgi:prepilin-type N-terminal cleavage/methylation domain-containing protein
MMTELSIKFNSSCRLKAKTRTSYLPYSRTGFTLIEVLVVVAIIALLVAILLPSLARARDQAQTTACASNLRQLHYAFTMYAHDNKGVYPGSTHDFGEDWLGYDNQGSADHHGHMHAPEDGVIWKYMSGQSKAYTCPAHPPPRWAEPGYWYYSYKFFGLMTGAKMEQVAGSHYLRKNFDANEHLDSPEHPVEYVGSVPLLVESLVIYPNKPGITGYENSWFVYDMPLANRHLPSSPRVAVSNVVYVDGHTDGLKLPGLAEKAKFSVQNGQHDFFDSDMRYRGWSSNDYFNANAFCLQMRTGKWVTMRSLNPNCSAWDFLSFAPPADAGETLYPMEYYCGVGNNMSWPWEPVIHPGD